MDRWQSGYHRRESGRHSKQHILPIDELRIPLIPDFNADKETIQRMCKKLRDFGAEKIELLPYHRLGKIKYENMNMSYQMKDDRLLPEELIRELKSIPESM